MSLLQKLSVLVGRQSRWKWGVLLGLTVLAGGLEAVGALLVFALLQAVTDPSVLDGSDQFGMLQRVLPSGMPETFILWLSALVAALFVLRAATMLVQTYLLNRVSLNAGVRLAVELLRRYLAADYTFHLRRNSAELIRNVHESTGILAGQVIIGVLSFSSELFLILAILAVLVVTTPVQALASSAGLAVAVVVLLRALKPRFLALGTENQDLARSTLHALQESLHAMREVRLSGTEAYFVDRFERERRAWTRTQYVGATLHAVPRVLLETLMVLAIVLFVVVVIISQGSVEGALATLGLVAYAALRILPSANRMMTYRNNVDFGSAAVDLVYEDLARLENQIPAITTGEGHPGLRSRIDVQGVSYHYPGSDLPALRDVTLTVSQGETIGIVGRTGSGKSTLVDLILGLLRPTAGEIRVDGQPLVDDPSAWQRRLGVVSQTIYLLDAPLRNNVAFGIPERDIDDERVMDAIRQARLEDVVEGLPEGIRTSLGERGVRLSGGQRQRVAIARALYRSPDVLVFDEGTSGLDVATEQEVLQAVESLRGDRTIIMVTHRLSTVRNCDRIVLLENGSVLARGTFDELRERSDVFRTISSA